jgi:hypothetical protein
VTVFPTTDGFGLAETFTPVSGICGFNSAGGAGSDAGLPLAAWAAPSGAVIAAAATTAPSGTKRALFTVPPLRSTPSAKLRAAF